MALPVGLIWRRTGSALDLILHSVAGAFDDDRLGMMQEPIQDGRGNGAVIIENRRPLFERFVGRQDNRAALLALADHLKE
jgi:hypothetical protein